MTFKTKLLEIKLHRIVVRIHVSKIEIYRNTFLLANDLDSKLVFPDAETTCTCVPLY